LSQAYVNKEFCMAVCGPYILAEREMMSQVCDHAAVSHPAPASHFHFQLLQLVVYAILRPNFVFYTSLY